MPCTGCVNSISSVIKRFVGEENLSFLLDLLIQHGVINEVYLCHICENVVKAKWRRGRVIIFDCKKGHPHVGVSAKRGTILDQTRLSPETIIQFCIMWCILPNPRQEVIRYELKCSTKTVVEWSDTLRQICINWVLENRRRIGGIGTVVEVDESKFGHLERQWTFAGVQRENKSNFFLVPVETRDKETLVSVIQKWILPGTTVISDCWKSYDALKDEDFQHLRENHSLEFVCTWVNGKVHEVNTQRLAGQDLSVHRSKLDHCKYLIPVFGRKQRNFAGHFAEYVFKSTFAKGDRLHHLLIEAAKAYPPQV